MNKRILVPDFYGQKKKFRPALEKIEEGSHKLDTSFENLPSDTEAALIFLKSKFPTEAFRDHLPPITLVHQLYSIVKCKTKVDQAVNALQSGGTIRLFKLGGEEATLVAIFSSDLKEHVLKCCGQEPVIKQFLNQILPETDDVSVDKAVLQDKFSLSEKDIRILFNAGLFTLRSASSFWFSFPNAGEFMKTYLKGRKAVLATIKKCKFREILQSELEQRKLKKSEKLGMPFYIHDIIGAELIECVETTSGNLLRLRQK